MPILELDGTLGATLIGVVIGSMSINSFHLILVCHFMYYYTITHFADFETLAVSNWSSAAHIPVGGSVLFVFVPPSSTEKVSTTAIVSSFVQFFYAYRLYLLNGRRFVVPAAIMFFSLLQTAMGASLAAEMYFEKERLSQASHCLNPRYCIPVNEPQPYAISALACECLCDILITWSMTCYIRKSETSILSSKTLQAIVQYAVNTGALTTSIAIAAVISWVIAPDALVDAALYIVMVRLYPCSFLSILNSRHYPPDIGDIMMDGPETHMSFLNHSTTTYQESTRHITQASSSSGGVK
ncbi:uncharacterized protein EV420DRAFT_1635214 [Desarmillaria tabescens]|uniref:DUF6534 domain-containing protein n=1 Tax=Armillaria tabescens TaxID=1929756 RepID=A0AA39NLY9_ARMTA|nr:uncharacterized protein EV420DRAFT_1635214 [Desarmillaria tabescens]KAK0467944.1 hypothetical protein EV420DRAFT_1635214 [Desarmillaria tabescens]